MARKSPVLKVVKFLGEYRIQDSTGTLLGSETNAVELDAHKDSLGFVWSDRQSADQALALTKRAV